jgi:hypothetical protein
VRLLKEIREMLWGENSKIHMSFRIRPQKVKCFWQTVYRDKLLHKKKARPPFYETDLYQSWIAEISENTISYLTGWKQASPDISHVPTGLLLVKSTRASALSQNRTASASETCSTLRSINPGRKWSFQHINKYF